MDKIIGIGNALVDILVRLEQDGPISRLHLMKGGMQLIDEDMQREVTAVMAPYPMEKAAGGSAGNVALALAGLGDAPGFVGAVGDERESLEFQAVKPSYPLRKALIMLFRGELSEGR